MAKGLVPTQLRSTAPIQVHAAGQTGDTAAHEQDTLDKNII